MSYQRDFTIGLRETQDFYLTLVIGNWRRGIAGFGLVGALVAWMYLQWAGMDAAWMAPVLLASAAASMLAVTLGLYLVTRQKVRSQLRASGRGSYLQQTEIGGFGVRVTVAATGPGWTLTSCCWSRRRKKPSTSFSPKTRRGSSPRPRWRTRRPSANSCGPSSAPSSNPGG